MTRNAARHMEVEMYKVWVLGVSDTNYATNGLVFDTVQEADAWGLGLLMRWTGAKDYAILPVELPASQGIKIVDCQPITPAFIETHQVQP